MWKQLTCICHGESFLFSLLPWIAKFGKHDECSKLQLHCSRQVFP